MGFRLEVSGAQINFNVEEFGIIRGYEFGYSVPDSNYAKGHKDHRELIIKGSISRTLTIYPDVLKQIRKWAKIEYKDRNTYYHYAKITHTHRDELIRYIVFPDAFVKDFTEEIDPHTGDGIYTLTLMQKLDKRINIEVGPFNEEHPSLSQLMEEHRAKREAQREADAVALAATLPQEEEKEPLNSPPYWVEFAHLASRTIRVETAFSLRPERNILTRPLDNSQINSGRTLIVHRARHDGGTRWFLVENPNKSGEFGWIPLFFIESANTSGTGNDTQHRITRETNNPSEMIVMASDFGSGRADSIRDVWGMTEPEVRPPNRQNGRLHVVDLPIDPTYNRGGLEALGTSNNSRVGLVDGTIVAIHRGTSDNFHQDFHDNPMPMSGDLEPTLRPSGTQRWIRVNHWMSGREVVIGGDMDYETMDRVALANEILRRHDNVINNAPETEPRIYLRELFNPPPALTDKNGRSSYANIRATANNQVATTRPTLNNGASVSDTYLSEDLLRAILRINDRFGIIAVNTIAGGNHTQNPRDEHYLGMAADFTVNASVPSTRGAGTVSNSITMNNRLQIINYLQDEWDFITQDNRDSDIHFSVTPDGYLGSGHFHISIFGRNH